jgi:2-polyprenyl-3-methyl-5-hydroxy-6-metoxy-1,4-benzoquinol methylase
VSLLKRLLRKKFDSGDYWRSRYEKGGNSGPGSYGNLARYKAEVVNLIVRDHAIETIVEFGCGDGNQAALFKIAHYTGVDISPLVVESALKTFGNRTDWNFVTTSQFAKSPKTYDMAMSLDVIYHLTEEDVFESYMRQLTSSVRQYLLIYASDHDEQAKDVHVRHRNYSRWLEMHAPEFSLVKEFTHPYPLTAESNGQETSFAHFKLFEKPQD